MKKEEHAVHPSSKADEGFVAVENARLYYRALGRGQLLVVLHGGPDFDHSYLLPDLDRLTDAFRLLYYDQRGRGKSEANVQPEDVSIQSEIRDLEGLRAHFYLEAMPILGHSWGGLLALEYAIQHPDRVSHLILMNTAPVSHEDFLYFRQNRLKTTPTDMERLLAWRSDVRYQEGGPDTVADYYRVHFRATIRHPEHLEEIIQRLRSSFTKEGILKAREIEQRLLNDTWLSDGYDLLPKLRQLHIPTLILCGEHDFIPLECSVHIEQAIPGARLVVLPDCGHFSYLECPDQVHKEIIHFMQSS